MAATGRRILIIEPSTVVSRVIAGVAESFGLEPVLASDFRGAIDLVLAAPPLVVYSSIELPGMPGVSLVAALRASPRHRVIPVAYVTSRDPASLGGGGPDAFGCPVFAKDPSLGDRIRAHLDELGFDARPGDEADPIRGRSILIAEDTASMRRLLAHRLHLRGAQVTLAQDGFEAGVEAHRGSFDLIALDIEMPRLDGRDVIALLQGSGVTAPILAMTAHTDPGVVDELIRVHGFDAVVPKAEAVDAISRAFASGSREAA